RHQESRLRGQNISAFLHRSRTTPRRTAGEKVMNPPRLNSNILISPKRQRRGERSRRWRSWLVVFLLAFPATAHAQSERDKPYDLTIVVHVAQNRLLTDVFRERIERELRDGFQAGLGDMGRVKVTHEHPRLADVLAR